jgi:hypothetical protein
VGKNECERGRGGRGSRGNYVERLESAIFIFNDDVEGCREEGRLNNVVGTIADNVVEHLCV